jgi:hypothetical protein
MARAQHRLTDEVVIEETSHAGVFRRRRIDLVERWANEGIITEKQLAAAEAFQSNFERSQLRERYAVSTSLLDRVDGTRHGSEEASAGIIDARERIIEALSLLGSSMGFVVWDVIGSGLSMREHVARQAGVKRVTVHEARGRLIAGLDILARAWL